jgi:hypothetical protein
MSSTTEPVDEKGQSADRDVLVEVRAVKLWELFPAAQLSAAHRECKNQLLWELVGVSPLSRRLLDAVEQIYNQTPRRHRRLAIEDDEFFHTDKVHKLEQARKYVRDGTRFFQPIPQRKKPLSTLLQPLPLPTDKRYIFTTNKVPVPLPTAAEPKHMFPGSIPVSMMEADIKKVYDGAYFFVWAPKTNGLRFFAVGCNYSGVAYLFLINRSQQIFMVPGIAAPDVLFDGTIFDGELVPTDDGQYSFVAYDCAISCGVPCSEFNYLVRLQIAGLLIETWNKPNNQTTTLQSKTVEIKTVESLSGQAAGNDVCVLGWRTKRVYSPDNILDMFQIEMESLDHDTDGFMLTAVEPPIQIGQTQTIFKVKRATDHTIDFLANVCGVVDQHVIVDLVAMHNRGLSVTDAGVLWATQKYPLVELAHAAERLTGRKQPLTYGGDVQAWATRWLHGRIVECRYNPMKPAESAWDLEYLRPDKQTPNKIGTAEKTWKNIQENLSLMQIFPVGSLPEALRKQIQEWERRHPSWKVARSKTKPITDKPAPIFTAPVPLTKLISYN